VTTKLTYERLHEVLRYDPDTGEFWWVERLRGRSRCKPAGHTMPIGYRIITIDLKQYLAHRLVWMYVYGYFPEGDIDHVDRDRGNNRLYNLREVSRACNIRNSKRSKSNTSGICGVYWFGKGKVWRAFVVVDGEKIHLGEYKDFANAVCARLAAEQSLNWSGCDSSSDAYCWVRDNIQGGGNGKKKDAERKGTRVPRQADEVDREVGERVESDAAA